MNERRVASQIEGDIWLVKVWLVEQGGKLWNREEMTGVKMSRDYIPDSHGQANAGSRPALHLLPSIRGRESFVGSRELGLLGDGM